METIEDIVREMRKNGVCHDHRHWDELCDRIEKAYKFMVEGLNGGIVERDQYIAKLTDNNSKIIAELNEVRELNRKCCNENERLHAALQLVLKIPTAEIDSSLKMARMALFANGINRMCHAICKAQKIWKEGEEK